MLATTDGSNNLIIRYGTTTNYNGTYSSVLHGEPTGYWTTQACNGAAPTQGTMFTANGASYVIDRGDTSGDWDGYIGQIDDNGVDVPGTVTVVPGFMTTPFGFSSVVFNNGEDLAFVASQAYNTSNLQIWVIEPNPLIVWSNETYTNIQIYGGGYAGDFGIASYKNQIVVAYRGDSSGHLYTTMGPVPIA